VNPVSAYGLPAPHEGHFLLESGLHTDRWYDLETLFCDAETITPAIDRLVAELEPHRPTAICGPLVGGAFLAQRIARRLQAAFFYAERTTAPTGSTFSAVYRMPAAQRAAAHRHRIAVVDDMISAGSSTRATVESIAADGGEVVAVATLFLSGELAVPYFAERGIPLVAVERLPLNLWKAGDCPLCRQGQPLRSRSG
jgi:orotate phosphoribosyltransferase